MRFKHPLLPDSLESKPGRCLQLVCNFSGTRGSVMVATMDSDMKNIIELTEDNFETEVLRATGPVLVDFYAPWCGPCMMIAPLLEQFAADFAGKVKFAKVNIDHAPALTSEYEITGVPTLMLFRRQRGGGSGRRIFPAHTSSKHGWTRRQTRPSPLENATHHDSAHHHWYNRWRRTRVCLLQVRRLSERTCPTNQQSLSSSHDLWRSSRRAACDQFPLKDSKQ